MTPRVFGLAEVDEDTLEPDPERVRFWGMESPDGTVIHWRETDGRSAFATFESAASAEFRLGAVHDLALYWP